MPIYAFRCAACGHARDLLMKVSDPVPTVCPSCGAEAFTKQVTAAGFQLKGSGWYVTDFRDGKASADTGASAKSDGKADGKPEHKPASDSAAVAPAAAKPSAAPSDKA